jgi:hypothetical protein
MMKLGGVRILGSGGCIQGVLGMGENAKIPTPGPLLLPRVKGFFLGGILLPHGSGGFYGSHENTAGSRRRVVSGLHLRRHR